MVTIQEEPFSFQANASEPYNETEIALQLEEIRKVFEAIFAPLMQQSNETSSMFPQNKVIFIEDPNPAPMRVLPTASRLETQPVIVDLGSPEYSNQFPEIAQPYTDTQRKMCTVHENREAAFEISAKFRRERFY